MSVFKNRYRVGRWLGPVTGRLWYTAEIKRWWFPVWLRIDFYATEEEAENLCRLHAKKIYPKEVEV